MIPAKAHFIWFGSQFPWANVLAVQSAAARGDFEEVILHHADELDTPYWEEMIQTPGVRAVKLDPEALLEEAGVRGGALVDLYRRQSKPAARANMARAAILFLQGGVYMDLDVVTTRSLTPLREEADVFCGEEHIVLPHDVAHSRDPRDLVKAGLRLGVRDVFRRLPGGWRGFRRVEGLYKRAVNNAVFASTPGHAFVEELLTRMVTMSPDLQLVRFALGTHLLQKVVRDYEGPGLRVHRPGVFYPLAPEISEQWFQIKSPVALEEVLLPETRAVHWYASVRTKEIIPQIDPDYVRRHAHEQLFSALALPFLP